MILSALSKLSESRRQVRGGKNLKGLSRIGAGSLNS